MKTMHYAYISEIQNFQISSRCSVPSVPDLRGYTVLLKIYTYDSSTFNFLKIAFLVLATYPRRYLFKCADGEVVGSIMFGLERQPVPDFQISCILNLAVIFSKSQLCGVFLVS